MIYINDKHYVARTDQFFHCEVKKQLLFSVRYKMFGYVVLLSMIISTTWATYGVDVSQPASVSAFQCMKSTFEFSKLKTYLCLFLYR